MKDFIDKLLEWEKDKRLTVIQALEHNWLKGWLESYFGWNWADKRQHKADTNHVTPHDPVQNHSRTIINKYETPGMSIVRQRQWHSIFLSWMHGRRRE